MRDWGKVVRQRLAGLALEPEEKSQVLEELAGHLEETHQTFLKEGVSEEDAARHTLSEVPDWNDLTRRIYSARRRENSMTNRVRQLWLPGLLTLVLSAGILALLQTLRLRPWLFSSDGTLPVPVLYVPWLLALPLVGAMGAYLSWRAGGTQRTILLSIVFPVLPFLSVILVVLPVSLVVQDFSAHNVTPVAVFLYLLGWVLAPAVALLGGGLPVRLYFSRRLTSGYVAGPLR
jgi:hypothetical protein